MWASSFLAQRGAAAVEAWALAVVAGMWGCGGALSVPDGAGSADRGPPAPPAPSEPPRVRDAGAPAEDARCTSQPRVLASVAGKAAGKEGHLLLGDGAIYFVTHRARPSATLWKSDKAAGGAAEIATEDYLQLIGADRRSVVWSAIPPGSGERLFRADSDAAAPQAIDLGVSLGSSASPYLRAVASGHIVWSDSALAAGAFFFMPTTGGDRRASQVYPAPSSWSGSWAALGDSFFYVSGGRLYRTGAPEPNPGPGGAALATVEGETAIVGYGRDAVYLSGPRGVAAISTLDGSSTPLPSGVARLPSPLCASPGKYGAGRVVVGVDESVYQDGWTDCLESGPESRFAHSISRSRKGEPEPVELVALRTDQQFAPFAVDDACLYWTEQANGSTSLKAIAR